MEWHTDRILRLWGKTTNSGDPDNFHPAIFHMLDVAMVAQALLQENASIRWRRVLGKAINAPTEILQNWLPWLIALHDIGKVSASFQGISDEQKSRLIAEGFPMDGYSRGNELPHSRISEVFVENQLRELPDNLRRAVRDMAGGHHGFYSSPENLKATQILIRHYEPAEWKEARVACADLLAENLLKIKPDPWPNPENVSTASMAMTGFTILCDWLGSDHTHFLATPNIGLIEYIEVSAKRAAEVLKDAGFLQTSRSQSPNEFSRLFPDKTPPRPLQAAIDQIPAEILSQPCLAIIEAPTGEGKTEAALALAHRIAGANGGDELYYALPTTATSNQMYGRLQKYLAENLKLSALVKLVHGQAFLYEDTLRIRPLSNGHEGHSVEVIEWFAPKKRCLLAPFGVGTIDQAELAALCVRHVPLRMIGLAGKVVIVDEVHAYDVYMTTIIERLLEWLSAMGTSIILLSATLPHERRARLARAYFARSTEDQAPDVYPAIWVINSYGKTFSASPRAVQENRQIYLHPNALHFSDEDAEEKAKWLLTVVASGGCACWITNTVKRAQQIFEAIERLADIEVDRTLIHAQFPLYQRQQLEQEITAKYGPEKDKRPHKGIVVGTQVLEQSLDLDFDLMVSDVAPIDLLLQRAGRLHRHARLRPAKHTQPCLWINTNLVSSEIELGVDKNIYSEFILLQTWHLLKDRSLINLPADYRSLIEAVYGTKQPEGNERLKRTWLELKNEEIMASAAAQQVLLPRPDPDDSFSVPASRIEFIENEAQSSWLVAKTRLGEESITIVPLERRGRNGIALFDGQIIEITPGEKLSREIQLTLLRSSIRVSNKRIIESLKNETFEELFSGIADAPLLKNVHVAWMEEGKATLKHKKGDIQLMLDHRLGLVIHSKKGE